MADNLDLKIIIDTLLKSKGFEDAQAGLKTLAGTTNDSAKATDKASDKQTEFGKQMGGSRGAAADLTRVLLQQIGVTGAAGEAAKAAGTAVNFLSGAAGGMAVAATAGVAAIALIIPKLIEWMGNAKEVTAEQERLRAEMITQIPELERLAESTGHVSAALERQLAAMRGLAFAEQESRITALEKEIGALTQLIPRQDSITQKRVTGAEVLEEVNRLEDKATEGLRQEADASQKTRLELDAKVAELARLREAQRQGLSLAEMERRATEAQTKAIRDRERAERSLAAFHDRLATHELDQIQEELDERAFLADFNLDHDKQILKDMAAEGKARDAKDRADRKREAELNAARMENYRSQEAADRERVRLDQEIADQKAITQANAIAAGGAAIASLFGKSKAAAIAGAIADTYAAAVAAYKTAGGGPWGIPIMLFTIAQGLAQVRQIESQNVGFDDPVNDLLAAQLGRKFATDVLAHVNAGFGEGLRAQAAGTTIHQTTINRGTSINMGGVSGVIGSRTEFQKWFERTMTRAQRVQFRTSV